MARWAHPDVLDNGPAYIRTNCTHLLLIGAYTAGDDYATVAGNALASVVRTTGNFTLANDGSNRRLTSAAVPSGASASAGGGGVNNHWAFVDATNSKVLYVTPESTGQAVADGNPVNIPALTYTARQPIAP